MSRAARLAARWVSAAAALALLACGGPAPPECGAELTGIDPCLQAQEYIECGPCPDAAAQYAIDTEDCEGQGTLLCANCIQYSRYAEECVLDETCAAECDAARL